VKQIRVPILSILSVLSLAGIMLLDAAKAEAQPAPPPPASKDNLQLILAGPFVVCDTGGNQLRILVPNVIKNPPTVPPGADFSHYPPGFTATLSEIALQVGENIPSPKDFSLQLPGYNSPTPQVVSDNLAFIDQVKVSEPVNSVCLEQSNDVYAALTVPKPDILIGMLPESVQMSHMSPVTGHPIGTPDAAPQKYATEVLMFYKNVDVLKVYVCQGGTVFWPKTTALTNCAAGLPAGTQPLFRSVGGQAVLTFDMRRKMQDLPSSGVDANAHAKFVNSVMSKAAGVNRMISFPKAVAKHSSHGDCNGGGMLVCAGAFNTCQ